MKKETQKFHLFVFCVQLRYFTFSPSNSTQLFSFILSYRTVIDTLKSVEDDRKCFRLIGGVLCERTVKEVLPQLTDAKEQLEKLIGQRQEQMSVKGLEINKFKETHNIKIKGEEGSSAPEQSTSSSAGNRNHVLVSN